MRDKSGVWDHKRTSCGIGVQDTELPGAPVWGVWLVGEAVTGAQYPPGTALSFGEGGSERGGI